MADAVSEFSGALTDAGLHCSSEILPDDRLHRYHVDGDKPGTRNGWYVLHGNGVAAGAFGSWRTGENRTWCADRNGLPKAEYTRLVAEAKTRREKKDAERQAQAKHRAELVWSHAKPADPSHPYLVAKQVQHHGVRVYKGALLVVPVRDAEGELHSLQFITPDGDKRFLAGGRVQGCFHAIGAVNANPSRIYVGEGYATMATVHEAIGQPCIVGFNAGNLRPVAEAVRQTWPDVELTIVADNDQWTEGNPGVSKATAAASAVGAKLAVPRFRDVSTKPSDFNDLAHLEGLDEVRRQLEDAIDPVGTDVPDIPDQNERPCFRVFEDWVDKRQPGVWYFGIKASRKKDEPLILTEQFVCTPLYVDAVTFDHQDNNFGRLLRFRNTLGRWREWAMPMELLRGSGDELRGELFAMGADVYRESRILFEHYLQSKTPKRRIRCALQVGWCGDSFVLPDTVIGPAASDVIFQSGERGHEEFTQTGTLDGWRSEIAALAVGNPVLTLALSAAFAGPLLSRCHAESGGINFVEDTSMGKTAAIKTACSVWGGPSYMRSWAATVNGMEGAAAMFNDSLLALDDTKDTDGATIGAIVYSLANGVGKQRAGRTGKARSITRWRCFVLSSGEKTIETHMAESGRRIQGGQTVRLLDIQVKRAFGCWDDLHGFSSGAAFTDHLHQASETHHGHAGRAFLEKLTHDTRDFCALLGEFKALPDFQAEEGQHKRAAARLALAALAGELATEYGITGWPEGEAVKAAVDAFKRWCALRGKQNTVHQQIVEAVLGFVDRHGDSRFSFVTECDRDKPPVRDRAGWWRTEGDERIYLFTADGLREALKGFDFKRALDVLVEVGALPKPGANGERAQGVRVQGRKVKLYPITASKLDGQL